MSQNEKISVVVPCYNVEKYLARCIDSLLSQTYKNIEIILVEDCSTDDTKDIVTKYASNNKNIRAIYNEKNGGLGHARNVGIAAATAKYIAFLDSDDWFPDNFLSQMYKTLVMHKADVSVCDIYLRFDNPRLDQRVISYNPKPNKLGLINTGMAASSSNKLFKKSLFKDLQYPEKIVNEDIPIVLAIMSMATLAYNDATYLNYYQRPGSIQNRKITSKRFDVFKSLALLKANTKGKISDKIWQYIIWHQILAVFLYVIPKAKGVFTRKKLLQEFYELTRKNNIDVRNNIGLKEFIGRGRASAFYGKRAIRYLEKQQFIKLSILMGLYSFYVNNKAPQIFYYAVRHPLQFARKLLVRLKPKKHVIRNGVKINDLIDIAKKQNRIVSTVPVSVIVPNYNYEKFLIQRIYSILFQTGKVGEIIILDDNSTDDSVILAEKISKLIGSYVPVRLINNEHNKGTFRQWERGFKEAKFDYIWIAEADDYSDKKFLETVIMPFSKNDNLVISYANTGYINEKGLLLGDVRNDIDYQNSGHWNNDYESSGIDEAQKYTYLNNTIANVSSAVFKKNDSINYSLLFKDARQYRQAGDWVFYVNYMLNGDIAYTNNILNYYRIHGNNVSSTTKAQDHINEILKIQKYFTGLLQLNNKQINAMSKRIELLKKAWNIN